MEHQPSPLPLNLRRSNDQNGFDWTEDEGPAPPPGKLFDQRDAFRPHYPVRTKQPAAQTDPPANESADQASDNAPTVWHAGLLPEDRGEIKMLR